MRYPDSAKKRPTPEPPGLIFSHPTACWTITMAQATARTPSNQGRYAAGMRADELCIV